MGDRCRTVARAPLTNSWRESKTVWLGARGTGTFAVLRRLLLQRRWRQVELAAMSGVTQARVSQILNLLKDEGIAIRDGDGWGVTD